MLFNGWGGPSELTHCESETYQGWHSRCAQLLSCSTLDPNLYKQGGFDWRGALILAVVGGYFFLPPGVCHANSLQQQGEPPPCTQVCAVPCKSLSSTYAFRQGRLCTDRRPRTCTLLGSFGWSLIIFYAHIACLQASCLAQLTTTS